MSECECEFEPDPSDPEDQGLHFKRVCPSCGEVWFSLHCPHDGHQRPCPGCGYVTTDEPRAGGAS